MAEVHNTGINIWQMITARLPYLADGEISINGGVVTGIKNTTSIYIVEVMSELNICLQKDSIGDESVYSIAEKSLISDLVCCTLLMTLFINNLTTDSGVVGDRVIKKAKAGSVEVEYETGGIGTSSLTLTPKAIYDAYMSSAVKRAGLLGCTINVTDNGNWTALQEVLYTLPTFKIIV